MGRSYSRYKQMMARYGVDDVLLTQAFTGLRTKISRPSILAAALNPDDLPKPGRIAAAQDLFVDQPLRWWDIRSAGHGVSLVADIVPATALIEAVEAEYEAAVSRS